MALPENEVNDANASVRLDPTNYLICRFAAAGTYYYNTDFNN